MEEIWKNVEGYEGVYEVSNLGRVRSVDRYVLMIDGRKQFKEGKMLAQIKRRKGQNYLSVGLWKNNKLKTCLVHRLVAKAFIPNVTNKHFINHKDENPENNCASNLEWCTALENINYGTRSKRAAETMKRKEEERKNNILLTISTEDLIKELERRKAI